MMNTTTDHVETVSLEAALAEFEVHDEDIVEDLSNTTELDDIEELEVSTEADSAAEITDLALEEIVTEDELQAVEATIEREKMYESQPATAPIASLKEAASTVASKKRKSAGAKTGRAARSLESVPAEYFVLDQDPTSLSETDLEGNKKAVLKLKPLQVKIAEKFENLFTSLAAGREPSRYTKMAFAYLYDKGEATTSDMVKMYQAAGLGEGTARSQSGQIMNLLSTVKIASRTGHTLTLLPTNTITTRLHKLISDTATAAVSAAVPEDEPEAA